MMWSRYPEFERLIRQKGGLTAGEVGGGELRTLFAAIDLVSEPICNE
jgi:hypothetical protein